MPRKVNRGSGRFAARTRTDRWRALHRTRMDRGDPRAYLLKGGFLIGSQPLFRRVYRCSDSCPGERGSKGGGERKRDPWIRGRKASFLPPALTSYHFSIYTLIEIPYRPCLPFRACLPRRRVEGLNCPFIAFFSLSLSLYSTYEFITRVEGIFNQFTWSPIRVKKEFFVWKIRFFIARKDKSIFLTCHGFSTRNSPRFSSFLF